MATEVQIYGTDWCRLTFGVREFLMKSRVGYDYFDIDGDAQADEFVRIMSDGRRRYPMVVVGQRVIINPTLAELQTVLDQNGVDRRHVSRTTARRSATREQPLSAEKA
jgi:glutaredoxin